jgi:streptomycin 6-kinase
MLQKPLPDDLRIRWAIGKAVLIADTPSSLVFRVDCRDVGSAVVKILKADGVHERPGIAFLTWRNGHGAVRLIDRIGDACLLEDAGTILLREHRLRHGEAAANAIIRDVLARLHAPSDGAWPKTLVPLHQHFVPLFERAAWETDPGLGNALRWSAGHAERLLAGQQDIRPLHGDLHHDNIMSGGPRGWLAIDPQGLIGDPAYDVANIFGNPLNAIDDILDPARIANLATLFSAAINCSEEKILHYAAAHAGLSICWSLQNGGTVADNENASERFAFLRTIRTRIPG